MNEAVHLERERVLGMLPERGPRSSRLIQDPGQRIRVGDVMSPVAPGDPAPGGGTYRAGQYSPHVDDLAISTFSSAKDAGILPAGLPIFDENGNVDKEKLDAWKPNQENLPINFAEDIPNYSSAVIVSSLKQIDNAFLSTLNMGVMQAPRTMGEFGNFVVSARTSSENRSFSSMIFVYPDFYRFIDKPIIPKTPKRESGISVSSFMVFHAVGHVVLAKVLFNGKISDVAGFFDSSGWGKIKDSIHTKASFMGRNSTSAWYKNSEHKFLSELSRYSPVDDFAQSFAFYFTHNEYLQKIAPEKYEIINKIAKELS
jgi:hypothetical protein